MTRPATIPVTVARLARPDEHRVELELPFGLTIEGIVQAALPGANDSMFGRIRVTLIKDGQQELVLRAAWRLVRPRPGVQIVVALVPGKDALRSILTVLVTIAATAIGQFWVGPLMAGTFGLSAATWASVATLGLTALGGLLINALLPVSGAVGNKQEKETFAISGWKNSLAPDAPVPDVMGKLRYAPPFAAYSYTEVVGDLLYTRAVFNLGYGPVKVTDLKLGDTPFEKYDEIDYEIREGRPGDQPLTLYTSQVIEAAQGVDLVRPLPRDDTGEIIDGQPAISTPIARMTALDASAAKVILSFPGGLFRIGGDGDTNNHDVTIKRRFRLAGAVEWTDLDNVVVSSKKRVGFFRAVDFSFPTRGRYEIELENLTPEYDGDDSVAEKCTWALLQTMRPEYPLNFGRPLALVAMRIKATFQLNGQLDNFNCVVSREAPNWTGAAWVPAETANPAALALNALRGPANAFPASDDQIDWQAFQTWHEYCALKGLRYNRFHDFDASLGEVLAAVGSAGRAAVRHNGRVWTAIVDRPRDKVIEHVNARNASSIRLTPKYFDMPDAWRIKFLDETNSYQEGERLVPRPGLTGPIRLTEQLELPGKTDPREIYVEGIRRWHELTNRACNYSAVMAGSARVATMGDLVMMSRDLISTTIASARVKALRGNHVELDDAVTMVNSTSYAIRFRQGTPDAIGESVVRKIVTVAGDHFAVSLVGEGVKPLPGDIIHFGPAVEDSIPLIVAGIERGKENSTVLNMLPAAEIIDTLTDATIVPPWDGRVGMVVDTGNLPPSAPKITGIVSGYSGTGETGGLRVYLIPGSDSAAVIATYELQHRLAGAGMWSGPVVALASASFAVVPGYASGDHVELRGRSISDRAIAGPYGPTVTAIVGQNDALPAQALASALVTPGYGNARLDMVPGADTDRVVIYSQAGTGGVLDRVNDMVKTFNDVTPGQPLFYIHGDGTRTNLVVNGDMASGTGWGLGVGWTIASGVAHHATGTDSSLSRACALTVGQVIRWGAKLTNFLAGNGQFFVSDDVTNRGPSLNANGTFRGELTVPGSPPQLIGFHGGSAFVADVDDLYGYVKTPTCLLPGDRTWWIEVFNRDGLAGPVATYTSTIS